MTQSTTAKEIGTVGPAPISITLLWVCTITYSKKVNNQSHLSTGPEHHLLSNTAENNIV